MNLDDTIRLQALKVKKLHNDGSDDMNELFLEQLAPQAVIDGVMKNICASVSLELFEQVHNFCSAFDISKRLFVELALIDALRKASLIVDEVKPFRELA